MTIEDINRHIKILNEEFLEDCNESFEKFDNGVIYTTSAYDVKNLLKDKPMRVVYDAERNYYFVGNAFQFIHQDLIRAGYNQGLYYDVEEEESVTSTIMKILYDGLETQSLLLLSYFPEDKDTDIERTSDGYTNKYILENGICYTHMFSPLEEFPLYKVLDVKKFIQLEMPESLDEKLEELEQGIYATQSAYDILNWMKNKPNAYRIVYDKNIRTYFICDAYNWIHQDMLEAAYRSGFYPDMFSQGEVRDYLDDEVYNGTLLFFAFSPKSDKQLDVEKSSDGYTQKYEYDFGTIYSHELTSLEDFDIYQLLGTPNKKEFIYESIEQLNKGIKRLLS